MEKKTNRLLKFGALAFAHIKQEKLDGKVVKFCFISYLEWVKGYMYGGSKFIISICVNFYKTCMGMNRKDLEAGELILKFSKEKMVFHVCQWTPYVGDV